MRSFLGRAGMPPDLYSLDSGSVYATASKIIPGTVQHRQLPSRDNDLSSSSIEDHDERISESIVASYVDDSEAHTTKMTSLVQLSRIPRCKNTVCPRKIPAKLFNLLLISSRTVYLSSLFFLCHFCLPLSLIYSFSQCSSAIIERLSSLRRQ